MASREGLNAAGNSATITGASPATATRDLSELVTMGALMRAGERKHTRYQIATPFRPVMPVERNERGD